MLRTQMVVLLSFALQYDKYADCTTPHEYLPRPEEGRTCS